MDFRSYWQSLSRDEKTALASTLDHNRTYLAQIACGARKPSARLAREINRVTERRVPLHVMRPDIWDAA